MSNLAVARIGRYAANLHDGGTVGRGFQQLTALQVRPLTWKDTRGHIQFFA